MWASAANAARGQTYTFSIRAQPVGEALINFAIQANISLGGLAACRGTAGPLLGRFTIDEGLTRLLARSDCSFVHPEPRTVRIVRAAPIPILRTPATAVPRPLDTQALSEVIVTATKRRVASDRVAASVSAIGAEQLRQSDTVDAGDLIAQLAGMATTNLGPGRDKIIIRGMSDGPFTGRTQSTVGIYLDDVPITYNAPDPDLRLADIQAVEVLRGPQGALYGAGNLSGIYHIVTNKPELDRAGGYLRVGGSVTRSGDPGDEIEAMVNTPFAEGRAAFRGVAYREVDGGYIDDISRRVSNVDRTLRYGGRGAVRALIGPDWTATVGLTYQHIHSNDTQYVDPAYGRLHRANEIRESADNTFTQLALAAERATPWGDFNATIAVLHHDYSSRADASTALPIFGAGQASVGAYDEDIENRMLVFDSVLTSPNSGRFRWLLGASGSASLAATRSGVNTAPDRFGPGESLYVETRKDRLSEIAAYGEASFELVTDLTLVAGGRLSTARVETASDVHAPQSGRLRSFHDHASFEDFTPTLALKYQATQRTLLYTLASAGRRPGGFNTGGPIGLVFVTAANARGVRRRYDPDSLWNLEAGLKTTLFDGRLKLKSAGFYETWRNIQTDQYLSSGLSYTANAGDGRNLGMEFELDVQPVRGLTIHANALLDRPRLVSVNANFSARAGAGLPGVPSISAGGRIAYEWPTWGGLTAVVSSEAEYIGRSHLTFDPVGSPQMGGYVLSKIGMRLMAKEWSLAATVINPVNASGNTFSYGNPFEFRQTRQVTPQRPRTIRLSATASF